ncbi:Dual specificity protein phosphatase, putative [Hondaea fermentalgiana]|uniref:protein-serine/threonine phosphatase n=1 Tax=Hondaea fermentalgiana TaxID=2315210 RepID=A0A2R5GI34_9STRA|nr:Dual specificity protein phosphatase, putative [Hondaea fermentalgiana]|eukprot:GBG30556.1 Dual specificity protein phosphatase, putative [Hondaea fermentalgiana]
MTRETMQEVRETLRGVDVVRVRNALITHSFVASKHVAESEDNAGPDVGEPGPSRATMNPMARGTTARAKKDTVDPYLREVLQALMDVLLPTDICRLITALDLANTNASPRRKAGANEAAHGKTVSASAFAQAGASFIRRANSLPNILESGKKRQRRDYFIALISNRTHTGVEEDAIFVLRAHVNRSKDGVGPNGTIMRKTKSLKRLSWKRSGSRSAKGRPGRLVEEQNEDEDEEDGEAVNEAGQVAGTFKPPRTSVLRDAGSYVGDSIAKAPHSSVSLAIVKIFPIWSDLRISLKGRGLVRLASAGDSMRIGTVSIRSMWRLVVSLTRARSIAKANNYFPQGPSHKWIEIYLQDLLPSAMPPGLEAPSSRHLKDADADGEEAAGISKEANGNDGVAQDDVDDDNDEDDIGDDVFEHVDIDGSSGLDIADAILMPPVNLARNQAHEVDGHLDHLAQGHLSDDDEDTDDATSVSVHTDLPNFSSVAADADAASVSSRAREDSRCRLSLNSRLEAEQEITAEIRTIIQTTLNLDDLTTQDVITRLEAKFGPKLMSNFKKSFIDEKIILMYGQQEPPSRIIAGLYLGTEYNASDFGTLQNIGVTTIINVTKEIKDFYPGHFDYLRISVKDHETSDLHAHFAEACEKIAHARAEGHTVFVHCQRGISRSATIVIAFLMQSRRLSFADAYNIVKRNRPIIKPNRGFIKQLTRFEEEVN